MGKRSDMGVSGRSRFLCGEELLGRRALYDAAEVVPRKAYPEPFENLVFRNCEECGHQKNQFRT